jgi:hypothetical protein
MRITIKIYTSSSLDLDTYTASHYNISGVDPSTLIWSCSPRLVTRDIAQEIASFSVAYPAYTGYWRSGIANPVLASYINCRLNTLGTLVYFSHGFLRVVIFLGICTYWSEAHEYTHIIRRIGTGGGLLYLIGGVRVMDFLSRWKGGDAK